MIIKHNQKDIDRIIAIYESHNSELTKEIIKECHQKTGVGLGDCKGILCDYISKKNTEILNSLTVGRSNWMEMVRLRSDERKDVQDRDYIYKSFFHERICPVKRHWKKRLGIKRFRQRMHRFELFVKFCKVNPKYYDWCLEHYGPFAIPMNVRTIKADKVPVIDWDKVPESTMLFIDEPVGKTIHI